MPPVAKTRLSRSIDVTSSFLGADSRPSGFETGVSTSSFESDDECGAAFIDAIRDRMTEVLPDVMPTRGQGENEVSDGIHSHPMRADHTDLASPVKRT